MNRLFLFFDLCGLSAQFRTYTNQLKFHLIIFILHIILETLATVFVVIYLLRPDDDEIARLNDCLKFSALIIVNWLSLVELYSKRNLQKLLWHCVLSIDQHFCSHKQYKLQNYLNKLKIYFVCAMIAYAIYLYRLINNTGTKFVLFWFSYSFMMIFFKIRSFYYVFYLEFIKSELRIIDHEVTAMLNDCTVLQSYCMSRKSKFAVKFYRNRFNWIRQYYGLVYDLCCNVNTLFGWSNVVVILFTFHLILMDINWAYWKLINKF